MVLNCFDSRVLKVEGSPWWKGEYWFIIDWVNGLLKTAACQGWLAEIAEEIILESKCQVNRSLSPVKSETHIGLH